ncbi:PLP-dependent aminotransferase family protein [Iamia sp. SCSIO 61187]|uniref:aminotransferase-like domain-containing protein n=1 Tax=Iamia sp. SCSIO 61187 TaxID=2722752 RepID=UPI001C62E6D4|nr:PLP-dependent aminotransferase family protein [Iamia sp. SCSIO 61187]QYG95145.1 PLP-dependent aminotransferase family protein [Iamia sp. SCSIO 61187]
MPEPLAHPADPSPSPGAGPAGPIALSQRAQGVRSSAIRDLLKLTEQPGILSLAGGLPAPESFPTGALAEAAASALADPATVQYTTTEGLPALREWIAARCDADVGPDDVLVTTGSQQALDLIVRSLCDPGDTVAADCPGYLGALQVLQAGGCRVLPVTVDEDGLDPEALAALLEAGERPRLVYTCPSLQNPTGTTLPVARRRRLAELADRYGFVIVEDDPYSSLRWAGTQPPAMVTMTDRAVWLSTFSKTLAPGLRLGWMVGPPELRGAATRLKQSADLHTPTLSQHLAVDLVTRPGWFAAHLAGLVPRYQERAGALAAALRDQLGDRATFVEPEGGMFLWLELPGVDTDALLPRAVEHGVAFVPGSVFHVDGGGHSALRVSFATLAPDALAEATARLARALT